MGGQRDKGTIEITGKAKEKEIERAGKDGEIEEEQGVTYAGGKIGV